nr:ABC transporter permease subunit [Aerococcus sanguinicola]
MKKMLKLSCIAWLFALFLPLLSVFPTPVEAKENHYVIGLDDTFSPMGFRDNEGKLIGFDIDLAEAVADLNGWSIDFQPIDWSMKETELNTGNIDMIWNGFGITPEREKQFLLTEPYIDSKQMIITRADDSIDDLEDLAGKKVGSQSGSTTAEEMKTWPNDLYKRLDGEPVLYPSYNEVFADLDAGRIDAIATGTIYGLYTLQQRPEGQYKYFVNEDYVEPMAVALRKEDTQLKETIDQSIQTLKENGTYDEIYNKWFAGDQTADWGQSLVMTVLPSLLSAFKMTFLIFIVVLILSIPVGFLIAILRVFGPKWLQGLIEAYVFVMRGSPLMLQLMVFFFGLPYIGLSLDRFTAAIFAFVINYAAYFTEIFRGGISSVPDGQFESINVLGIGHFRGFRRIILPQVMKIVMPSVGNEVISLVKDTSLVYVIGLGELLRAGSIAANTYATLTPYLLCGAIYLLFTAVVTFFLKGIESRIDW